MLMKSAVIGAVLALLGAAAAEAASPPIYCDESAIYDASTNGATKIAGAVAGYKTYICGYSFFVGATATNVSLVYGTGTNCGTGQAAITPAYQLPANGGIVDHAPFGNALSVPASADICLKASAGNPVQGLVRFTRQLQ
jgi:hypothetical protein